jgi:hypothetical protein
MAGLFFLFVAGIILVFVGIAVYGHYQAQTRMAEMRDVAARRGYEYVVEEPGLADALAAFALFSRGHSRRATNVLRTRAGDTAAQVFDYRYTTGHGNKSHTHRQSVLLVESERLDLPAFSLCPETVGQKLAVLFGRQDIDFQHRVDFSENYVLQGDDEDGIRALFDDDVLAFFARRPGLCLEGRGRRLLYYRAGQQVSPNVIHGFLGEGLAVLDRLAAAPVPRRMAELAPEPAAEPTPQPAAEPAPEPATEPDPLAGLDALLAEMGVKEDETTDEG